jgi:hypothetical protein
MQRGMLMLLLVCFGCSPTIAPPAPVAAPVTTAPVVHPPRPLTSFQFASERLERLAFAMEESAARTCCGPTSSAHLFQRPSYARQEDYEQEYYKIWKSADRVHEDCIISMGMEIIALRSKPDFVQRVDFDATIYPENALGTRVTYAANENGKLTKFTIEFIGAQQRLQTSYPSAELKLPINDCRTRVHFEKCEYDFTVALPQRDFYHTVEATQIFADYLSSPESFLSTGLNQLDALAEKVEQDFQTRIAWVCVTDYSRGKHDVQERRPSPQDKLPYNVKQQAMDSLLKDIERQKTLITQNHALMFQTVRAAVPFYEDIHSKAKNNLP